MELNHKKDRLCRSTTEPSVNLTYSLLLVVKNSLLLYLIIINIFLK